MKYRELSNEQRRQWLDFMQVDHAFRADKQELDRRFAGSMRWLKRGNDEYLHAKRNRVEKSLGPRNPDTEKTYAAFTTGRKEFTDRVNSLQKKLKEMAPVNRALGLGRVPNLTAMILRRLSDEGLLGTHFLVAGTNALWAYEAKAGIQLQSELVATADADFLWDPRLGIELVPTDVAKNKGLLGILTKIDDSFKMRGRGDFRVINKSGFAVDLIRPEDTFFFQKHRNQIIEDEDDLTAAPIFGLQWLLNAPRMNLMAIAEDGLSVPITTYDPRAFALHKLWLSQKNDRDPIKVTRDRDQALTVAEIATKYLALKFNPEEIRALPKRVQSLVSEFLVTENI